MRIRYSNWCQKPDDVAVDAAGEQDEAAFQGLHPDFCGEGCVGFVVGGVGEFDGDHEAGAADV